MKIFLFLLLLLSSNVVFARPRDFVNPMTFKNTEKEKKTVVDYIKRQTKEEYRAIDMDDPMTLRMMENENLKCFKYLVSDARNSKILNKVIKRIVMN